MLPSITNVINLADSHDRAAFAMVTHVKQEPRERENSESKEEVSLWLPGWSYHFELAGALRACFYPKAEYGASVQTLLPLTKILVVIPICWYHSEPVLLGTGELILN